ncbi:MAG: hypothetical protein ACI3ZL_05175 [Candidatus Cryptobacteroides sp.]
MGRPDIISLTILSPERTVLETTVSQVELPGVKGRFTVLRNHAPLISSLAEGKVAYVSEGVMASVDILSGFVEINDNVVTVCAEVGR